MWCRAPPLSSMKCQTFSLQPCSITHELKSGLKKNMKWRIWRYPHWQLASATGARRAALGEKKKISFAYHTSKVLLLLKLPFSLHILFLSEKKKNWYSNPKWNLFLNVKQLNYQAYPSYLLNMGNILKLHTKSDFKLLEKHQRYVLRIFLPCALICPSAPDWLVTALTKQPHVEVRDHLFWIGWTGEAISEDTSGLTGNRPDGNGSMLPGLRLVTDDSQLMLRSHGERGIRKGQSGQCVSRVSVTSG